MDGFDGEDEVFLNSIKTVDDILSNPILTTERRDILKTLKVILPHSRTLKKAYSKQGSLIDSSIKKELILNLQLVLQRKKFGIIEWNAIDLVITHSLPDLPLRLLEANERFEILHLLRTPTERFREAIVDNLSASLDLYQSVRSGTKEQLGGKLSPMIDITSFRKESIEDYVGYAFADATLEAVIHKRQTAGLDNRPGSIVRQVSNKGWLRAIRVAGDVVVFETEKELLCTSWDDFLCIRSMAIYRRNSYLLCSLDPNLPKGLSGSLTKMMAWQESCVAEYGNKGYELAKATESIFKARLMQLGDGVCAGDAFELMVAKQVEKERAMSSSSDSPMVFKLRDLANSVSDKREACELFGSLKFCGHPYIDPALASRSSKEHGTAIGSPRLIETLKMRSEFCSMILKGYISKWGRWPALIFSPNSNTKLERLFHKKKMSFSSSEFPYTDWHYASFPKFLDFDYHIDYLDLMEDKSTGLDPQDAWKAWDELKRENPSLSKIPDSRSKKLMIRILSMPEFDPFKICEEIRRMDLTTAELSMALYPKEREFKLEARLFVMLEFPIRVFLTLAEKNFKRLMKDYMPEQSMTKGRKGTMQYLESLSLSTRNEKFDTCYIEIDLSRWNLLWRGAVVNRVSTVADDIFGLPGAFSRGHEIFRRSTVVVRVPSELPSGVTAGSIPSEWPEGEYIWRNHVGGFEGIIQGQWTACTQAEIKLVMRDLGIENYKLLGQGDNQVLAIVFRRDPSMSSQQQVLSLAKKVTEALEKRFAMLNQIVKPDECLASRTTVTYSKICFCDGVQYPTTLKHAATVAPVGTSSIPGLLVGLSALSSGARASADSFSDPTAAYLYFLVIFRDYLRRASKTLPCHDVISGFKMTPTFLNLACLIPGDLGGLPIQTPSDFMYGGCSDRLSAATAALVAAARSYPDIGKYLGFLDTDAPWKPNPDARALLDDPFGAPILPSIGADVKIDGAIRQVVPDMTENREIKQILSAQVSSYEDQLKTYLVSVRPLYPLLMADAVDLSICGVKKKIFKKFSGTRTIQQLVRRRAPINYGIEIKRADLARIRRIYTFLLQSKVAGLQSSFPSGSIFARVESYRQRWFPDNSTSLKGVTTIHPFESELDPSLERQSSNYLETICPRSWESMTSSSGPHAGRWGDKTWEHRKVSGVEILGRQKAALAAKRILLMESQLSAGGDFQTVLRQILSQRTTYDQQLLADLSPKVVGGVAAHRWDSTIEDKAFAWLGPIGPTQHVSVQTDSMDSLSGGSDDYSFCFQEHVFFAIHCMRADKSAFVGNPALRVHYQILDHHKIVSSPVTGPPSSTIKDPPSLHNNPLVCANEILFQALSEEMPKSIAPTLSVPNSCSFKLGKSLMIHHFLDQFENPVLSEALVDQKETPAGLSLDVGSLAGIGLQSMIKAAGTATFLRSLEMVYSETFKMDRVLFNSYIDRLSSVAALPLSRYANSPSVRSQAWVRKSGILISPGKHGGQKLRSQIAHCIRQRAASRLVKASNFATYSMVLSSYAERATPSRVLGCMLAASFLMLNPKDIEAGRTLYRRHLNTLRSLQNEKDRIAAHIRLISLLASSPDLGLAYDFAVEVIGGRVLSRTPMGLEDTKRYLRSGPGSVSSLRSRVKVQKTAMSLIPGVSFGEDAHPSGSYPRFADNPQDRSESLVRRNLGWNLGGSSLSRVFLPIASHCQFEINQGPCLVVGVGNGAMARDLFALGAQSVVGVDLVDDLPQLSSLGSAYVPPEIPNTSPPLKWRWASSVFTFGGNWFDTRVSKEVLSEQPSLVVIDIQPGTRMVWDDLLPIISSGISTTIVFRRELSDSELVEFLEVCKGTFASTLVCRSDFAFREYWFVVRTSRSSLLLRKNLSSPVSPPVSEGCAEFLDKCFYPNQDELFRTTIWKGRGMEGAPPTTSLDYALNYFRYSSHTIKTEEITHDVALSAYVASSLLEFNSRHCYERDDVIDFLTTKAIEPAPSAIRGVPVPKVRQHEVFSMFSRVAPRLCKLTQDGWTFII